MRMRRADLSQFALFKTTQISHSIFIEMKMSFFARYITLISHEWESYSNRPEIINVLPLNSKFSVAYCCVSFFVQYSNYYMFGGNHDNCMNITKLHQRAVLK